MKNIRELVLKTATIIIMILLVLSLNNAVALFFGVRPQTVISYAMLGTFISYLSIKGYDRVVAKKEDPLPAYVLKEVMLARQEVEIMKEIMESEYNTSLQEIRVRAKVRESLRKNETQNKRRSTEDKKET